MDGIEATRRALARLPGVRVVALTASVDEARMMGGLRAGVRQPFGANLRLHQ
jgi:DNA-binding NarL/FixJ family response regulator